MNYLAHAFLSGDDKEILIGNFIADHLRGNDFSAYSPKVIEGIRMHRKIDEFTDAHPLFKLSKRVFYKDFEKFSGVLVDIYFDHLLAKHFKRYSSEPLKEFAQSVYMIYHQNRGLMPESSGRFLDYVMQNDIYNAYSRIEGIERVLFHLSGRINKGVRLDASVKVFLENENYLIENFQVFFEEAVMGFSPENDRSK